MKTDELIRALRGWAANMTMPGRRSLVNEAADRLEALDERVAIMEESLPVKGLNISIPLEHIDMGAMRALVQTMRNEGEIDQAFSAWCDWCHIHGLDPAVAWKEGDTEHSRQEYFTHEHVDFIQKRFHVGSDGEEKNDG